MRVPDEEFYDIALKEYKLIESVGQDGEGGAGHPNVIKVYDIFYNRLREKIFILMEYAG